MRHKSGHLGDVPITTTDIYRMFMVLSLTSLKILHELYLSVFTSGWNYCYPCFTGRETEAHILSNFTQGTEVDY